MGSHATGVERQGSEATVKRRVRGDIRIAIDLDNTLICYDRVFIEVARDEGLVRPDFAGGKQAVRDAIRGLPQGERLWQQVQGQVYGKLIRRAEMYDGAEQFLRRCRREGAEIWIVSHKTQFNASDPDCVDLRKAALSWMEARGLFDDSGLGLPRERVFFEATREDKIARLVALRCTHAIDDLVEVFAHPAFPTGVRKLLFDPSNATDNSSWSSWRDIEQSIFEPCRPDGGNPVCLEDGLL